MTPNNRFQTEIDAEIEQLAKKVGCSKESLEYMVFHRENGFVLLTVEAFNRLRARDKNKLLKAGR